MSSPFVPPPADEPIPEHAGATDKDQPGSVSPNQDTSADLAAPRSAAAAVAGAPTLHQVLTLAASKIKLNYGPPENVNAFTRWYYGNGTSAAWCFIFLSWVFAHAGSSASAGLALIDGKRAYVPYIRQIPGVKIGHSGVKAGDLVALFSFAHIEIVEKVLSGGRLQTLGGNTARSGSDDAVSREIRSVSSVAAHFSPAYASGTPTPTPTPATVDEDCWVA